MKPFSFSTLFRLTISLCLTYPLVADQWITEQNRVLQVSFDSSVQYSNPFKDVMLDMVIEDIQGRDYTIPGYWDGEQKWSIRFSNPETGVYKYRTVCSDTSNAGLHGKTGHITVQAYTGSNQLMKHGSVVIDDKTLHLVHRDGKPFLWLADSWWHGMTKRFRWPEDFLALTQDRKEKGFSVVQFALGYACDVVEFDERIANEAGFPTNADYTKINPAYFDMADLRIQHLVDEGLMPNILGTWGYYLEWFGVQNMKDYWRYVIARYGAYPVTWTVAGETTLIYYLTEDEKSQQTLLSQREGWSEVARFIQETDPYQRILTAHPGPASGHFEPISEPTLLDMILVQPGHGGWPNLSQSLDHLRTAKEKFPDRPVMQGEVCFEGMKGGGSDAKLQRLLFWTNMLSGAAGHCYGVDGIWQFNTDEELFGKSPRGQIWGNFTWDVAAQWKGSFYVGLGRKILEHFPWQQFELRDDWISKSADPGDPMQPYAVGIPGEMRMFYFPDGIPPWGRDYHLLKLDTNTKYEAVFIDPMTAEEYPIKETIYGVEQWQVPQAPILQDWLLVLTVI